MSQDELKFEPGDVVILISGGPPMTVRSTGNGKVIVDWFDLNDQLFTVEFPNASLVPLIPEGEDVVEDSEEDDEPTSEGSLN